MKSDLKFKLLQHLNKKNNKEEGFTLIELLVVVIIIGVLAAVALPNLLSQVGKSRETEIKNAAGTVTRAQQSYHFEKQIFADGLTQLGITVPANYITNPTDLGIATAGVVSGTAQSTVQPENTDFINDGTRAYSSGIFYAAGEYTQIMCQSSLVTDILAAPTDATSCPGDATIIK